MKLEQTTDAELELDYDFLGEIATSNMLDAPDRVSHVRVAHDDDFAMFEDPEPGILGPFSSRYTNWYWVFLLRSHASQAITDIPDTGLREEIQNYLVPSKVLTL